MEFKRVWGDFTAAAFLLIPILMVIFFVGLFFESSFLTLEPGESMAFVRECNGTSKVQAAFTVSSVENGTATIKGHTHGQRNIRSGDVIAGTCDDKSIAIVRVLFVRDAPITFFIPWGTMLMIWPPNYR